MVAKLRADGLKAMSEGGGDKKSAEARKSGLINRSNPIPPVRTRKKLAEQAGVSERKIRQATAIADQPELLEQVKAGTLRLKDAVKQAKPCRATAVRDREGRPAVTRRPMRQEFRRR